MNQMQPTPLPRLHASQVDSAPEEDLVRYYFHSTLGTKP